MGWRPIQLAALLPVQRETPRFDTYRAAELERLEREQREFKEFIDRLRQARDKAEFDQFMADRRRQSESPGPIVETGAPQRDA